MLIYHGGYIAVTNPKILTNGFYKDFGFAFYCTNIQKQAEKWARTKHKGHIVSTYYYMPQSFLRIKNFEKMTDEWLDFIVRSRIGEMHDFDIVEGPMADDTIWNLQTLVFQGSYCL